MDTRYHTNNYRGEAVQPRSDLLSLIALAVLWIVMSALVDPVGDFPVNDDWVYGYSVKSVVEGGRFSLPSSAANVFAQAYWGALFCLPFGFSFTALRISTLILGGAGILTFYFLLRQIGGDRWIALIGAATLAVNPVYFGLANTFMTDVPVLALVITALWLFVRGVQLGDKAPLIAGIAIALIAVLIRQFALILLLAFGISYVVSRGATWKVLFVAIVPVVLGVGMHLLYQRWMIVTARTPVFDMSSYKFALTPSLSLVKYSMKQVVLAAPYLGFFTAPLLTSIAVSGSYPRAGYQRWLMYIILLLLTATLLAALSRLYAPIPEIGHIVTPTGLGPRTLRDTFFLDQNFPVIPAALMIFWFAGIAVGILGSAWVFFYLGRTALHAAKRFWEPGWRRKVWLEVLMLVFVCLYASILLVIGFGLQRELFDRYLLLFVPAIFALVLVNEIGPGFAPTGRWRGVLSVGLVLIYAGVSVAATHDYLAWNRMRWMATRMLMESGVSPRQIDGGYEFNGWYLYDPNYDGRPGKSWWWVDDDEYMIASGPLESYRELHHFVFRRWLSFSDASVFVLHRIDPGHP